MLRRGRTSVRIILRWGDGGSGWEGCIGTLVRPFKESLQNKFPYIAFYVLHILF